MDRVQRESGPVREGLVRVRESALPEAVYHKYILAEQLYDGEDCQAEEILEYINQSEAYISNFIRNS